MSIEEEDPGPRLAYDRTRLANERTYASWLRTGLSVAAFGFALRHLPRSVGIAERAFSAALVVAGAVLIAYGGYRYRQVARDLRALGTPSAGAPPAVIIGFTLIVAVLVASMLVLL